MKTLYEASSAVEAHMLIDVLRQQGLTAHVHGEALQGAMGELPAAGLVRLVVEDEDYPAARAAIERWEHTQVDLTPSASAPMAARKAPGLRGFVIGLAVGVAATYAVYRSPVTSEGIDHDRDGLLDEKWTYSPNGTPLKMEADRNLDKRIDYVARYDSRGLIESAGADDDFDGTFETRQRFRDGNLESSASDSDGDAYPDVRWHYAHGVLDTVEYLNPASGLPLRVEHYALGRLVFADVDSQRGGSLDVRIRYTPQAEIASRQPLPR